MSSEIPPQAESSAGNLLLKQKKVPKPVAAIPWDIITTTAHQIENLSQTQALQYVRDMRDDRGFNAYKLGGGLLNLMHSKWTGDCSTFRKGVEKHLGMRWRDAEAKMNIYKSLVNSGVTWEQLDGLSWSAVAIIASVLTDENWQDWVAKAKETTHGELRNMVEAHQKASDAATAKSDVTIWSVKLHPDQREQWLHALDKAKAEAATQFDAVAMDALAIGYLGGAIQLPLQKFDGKQWMQTAGLEAVLAAFDEAFPTVTITVEVPDEADPQGGQHGK
jgi:hypothetical protein